MTPAERKKKQRQRDKALGWAEVTLKMPADRIAEVRAFIAQLPPPPRPTDPNQLDLIDRIDQELASGGVSPK